MSLSAVETYAPANLDTRLAALGIPLARLLEAARIDRSTWSRWRAGKTRPRLDRWIAATAAFDALVADATPAPADVEPEAAGAEPVTLTGSSAPTGAPPSFAPIATAAAAGDLVADCERARALIDQSRESLARYSFVVGNDARERQDLARATKARDAAVADLAARPVTTPRDLAAKATVILAGLGPRPDGGRHEVVDYVDLVRSTAADAARLGSAADAMHASFRSDLSTLAKVTAESDRLTRLSWDCSERTSWLEAPEALFCRPTDGLFFLGVAARRHDGRSWYNVSAVERLRGETFDGAFVDPGGRDRRRRDEIVAAYDGWQAGCDAAQEASGLATLNAESEACGSMMRELRDVMLDRPARTLDDVLAKAAVFSWWYVDEGERAAPTMATDRARMLAQGEGTLPFAMALGILVDLVAMAEARGLTLTCSPEPADVGAVEAPIAQAAA